MLSTNVHVNRVRRLMDESGMTYDGAVTTVAYNHELDRATLHALCMFTFYGAIVEIPAPHVERRI